MTTQIIGICGFIGSGKDTAADYLVNFHEFRRDSFAATLKDAVAAVFGWDRELLEGRTKSAREWREQVDPWWATRLNMPDLTPRLVLQLWGTEVCRRSFHDDIWIASLEARLRNATDNIVISDCRFPNEIKAIKNAGGKVIRVVRGPNPVWYDFAVSVNTGRDPSAQRFLSKYSVHASETAWVGTEFDMVIDNNGTVDELYTQLQSIVR
ncbi:hypothetical protein UFOVP71_38 [uncultured Caudovirales phage]|uniref:Deoxynucleoside monophosphate kinase n=1 Tax=uncultured Caudovirales phage TaxID=2100421 RepID=A0A6J5TD11_9CAUD|nr:hypothetical protein UFOVP71_38 [uncultured Caudovirales phage]